MSDMPRLPPGYEAFLTWSREQGGRYYEFHRVYDRRFRLDRARSFWITIPPEFEAPESVRAVSFQGVRRALGPSAPAWGEFSTYRVDPTRLAGWLDAAGAPLLDQTRPLPPPAESLPWEYHGMHWTGARWTPCSGIVPNEGHDEPSLARDAAEALQADRVILRDAAGRMLSIRDADGGLVKSASVEDGWI